MAKSAEWTALVTRAQEIDKACKQNAKDMEDLKSSLADFKKNAGGGSTPKKKGFWETLMGGEEETTNED